MSITDSALTTGSVPIPTSRTAHPTHHGAVHTLPSGPEPDNTPRRPWGVLAL